MDHQRLQKPHRFPFNKLDTFPINYDFFLWRHDLYSYSVEFHEHDDYGLANYEFYFIKFGEFQSVSSSELYLNVCEVQ